MKWLPLVIRCKPPLDLNEFAYILLGMALLQALFSSTGNGINGYTLNPSLGEFVPAARQILLIQ